MPEEYRQLVENLPYIRVLCGESTESFANKLGVTRTTYQNIENGRKPLTTLYWHAINGLIHELYEQNRKHWIYVQWVTIFPKQHELRNLVIKLIDDVNAQVSRKIGVKRKQEIVLKALDDRRKQMADILYGSLHTEHERRLIL